MRKQIFFLLVIFLSVGSVKAQYDPKAFTLLEAMSKKIKSMPSYTADFENALTNESEGVSESFKGKITVKGDKYRINLGEQEIFNNGATVWTYLPDLNEVNVDNYAPDEDEITLSNIYSAYKKGYRYIFLKEAKENGIMCDVVDLVPEDKDSQFFKIRMNINKSDHLLQSLTMFDKSGNQYKYTIKNFKSNATVSSAFFDFDKSKHPGVEVIDLR